VQILTQIECTQIDAFLNSISEHNFLNIMFFQCEYIEIKDHLMFFSLILCFSIILQGNPSIITHTAVDAGTLGIVPVDKIKHDSIPKPIVVKSVKAESWGARYEPVT
jgi:hypothetical protein